MSCNNKELGTFLKREVIDGPSSAGAAESSLFHLLAKKETEASILLRKLLDMYKVFPVIGLLACSQNNA